MQRVDTVIGMQFFLMHLMVMIVVVNFVAVAQVQHGYDMTIAVISNNRLASLKVSSKRTQYAIMKLYACMRAHLYHAPHTTH